MGLKRITFAAEATFPPGDTRSLEELKSATAQAVSEGLDLYGGVMARIGVTGAATDPDPETGADDVVIVPPPVETP